MSKWIQLADKKTVEETMQNLKIRGIESFYVENAAQAKEKVTSMFAKGTRVLTSASITLETAGIAKEVNEGNYFKSVKKEYMAYDHEKDADKIRLARSAPEVIMGSVHAVTKKGEVLIASNTGSQLAGYVYGAGKVIWVIGTQKIVENLDEGLKRIYEYVVPLENDHMQSLYKVNTNVSKLLIFNKEIAKNRVIIIFVNEVLGF